MRSMTRIDIGWVDPGMVHSRFAASITQAAVELEYFGALGGVHVSTDTSLVAAGRNAVVQTFLNGDSDYLWMVDSDMVFSKGHPIDLATMAEETGAEMVAGLAFIYQNRMLQPSLFGEPEPGSHDLFPIEIPESGTEIAACGMASVLIHRKVFETMEAPRHPDYRWFDQIVLDSGLMSGEDIQFFLRARALGYTLRVCTGAETTHLKEIGFARVDYERAMDQIEA